MKQKHFGKCALCGKECNLTFEHIPPSGAYNNFPVKLISGEEAEKLAIGENNRLPWDVEGLKYNNLQKGQGMFSLCSGCNNKTGSWYANEYNTFVKNTRVSLSKCEKLIPNTFIKFVNVEFYPLRFFKQIVSMFLSINNGFFDNSLRKFVLNKDSIDFNSSKYKIYMYLSCGGMGKLIPATLIGNLQKKCSVGIPING